MPKLYSYTKAADETTTYRMALPEGATELCEIDGTTYVSLPNDAVLPEQAVEIAASVTSVTLTSELRETIKVASPHCQLIAQRVLDKIAAEYSADQEMYFARIGVGKALGMYQPTTDELAEMATYAKFVEAARQWGRDERTKLGL